MALLVTDGDQRATLAVVRAVGRAGIPVTVGSAQGPCLAGLSRFAKRTFVHPPPEKDPEGFLDVLTREARESRSTVLFPMTDVTLQVVSQNRARLEPFVTIPIAGDESIQKVMDKRFVLTKARELGISCPVTYAVGTLDGIEGVSQKVSYPVVLKPRFSRSYTEGRWVSGPVQFAFSPSDLIAKYRDAHKCIPDPMIQENVPGEGRGVFLLMWEGEIKAAFSHRRLREKPPWGGVSVYSESLPLDEKLVEQSANLLRACGLHGVGMVEYKLDKRDGVPKIMEVNGRFWGSLQLAIDAGMNFPLLLYRLAMGEDVPRQVEYRPGVRSRWLLGDLDHLLIRLFRSGKVSQVSQDFPSRFRACLDFLKFYEPNLYYDVFRLGDPRPGLFECTSYLWNTLRATAKRMSHTG